MQSSTALPSFLGGAAATSWLTSVTKRAVTWLVEWAATEVETPMYPSVEVNEEIAFGTTLSPIALRNLHDPSAVYLSVEWCDLPEDSWSNTVRTKQGREVPASETVWMRSREVWVHAVDVNNGATFADLPDGVLSRLLGDITGAWKSRGTDADFRSRRRRNCPGALRK